MPRDAEGRLDAAKLDFIITGLAATRLWLKFTSLRPAIMYKEGAIFTSLQHVIIVSEIYARPFLTCTLTKNYYL